MSLEMKPFMELKHKESINKSRMDRIGDINYMKNCVNLSKQLESKE